MRRLLRHSPTSGLLLFLSICYRRRRRSVGLRHRLRSSGGEMIPIRGAALVSAHGGHQPGKRRPEDVLHWWARNVRCTVSERRETEFLVLLRRYVDFARELRQMAGADGVIRVENCDDAERLWMFWDTSCRRVWREERLCGDGQRGARVSGHRFGFSR